MLNEAFEGGDFHSILVEASMNEDIQVEVVPVKQDVNDGGRVYRCEKCQQESPVLNNGTELRNWFLNHACEE